MRKKRKMKNKKIVVLGGGNAGYMTALFLQRMTTNIRTDVVVVQSEEKGTIGVGEAVVPPVVHFMQYFLGINLKDFISKTKSTIKNGIKFENWNGDNTYYYHPFTPSKEYVEMFHIPGVMPTSCYADYVRHGIHKNYNFHESHLGAMLSEQNKVSLNNLSYALHFDNFLVTEYFKNLCIERNIEIIDDEYLDANLDEDGYIESLKLKELGDIECDFVFDCSGFARLIMNKKYNINWKVYKDLAVNEAIIFPKDTNPDDEIMSYTNSVAMKNGWVFEIPLRHRIGRGYIFDNNFTTTDDAIKEIEERYGEVEVKKNIKFTGGRLEKFWHKNCIAVGLSSSFVEPLEATSIMFTITQVSQLNNLKHALYEKDNVNYIREMYSRIMSNSSDHVKDFIHFHYLGKRKDSVFWKSFRETYKSSDFVNYMVDTIKYGDYQHFMVDKNVWGVNFNNHGWLSVAYGLGMIETDKMIMRGTENLSPTIDDTINLFKSVVETQSESHLNFLRKLDNNEIQQISFPTHSGLVDKI
jgi:hypothetical protein